MNLPNKLSLIRIILIPFTLLFMLPINIYGWQPEGWNSFVNAWGMTIAAVIFIVASLTDYFDGKIARRDNLVTNLGKFLDPLADKVLVISVLIGFLSLGRVNAWCVLIIIFRDFMISGVRLVAASHGEVLAAKMIGKVKTAVQMVAIIYMLFEPMLFRIFSGNFMETPAYPLPTGWITILGDVFFYLCVILTIVSGLDYLLKNISLFKDSK
ncbi:MAG: CDP-diacylglycerol--glycerol-3-phosphate 3-phosphatidyltransferase [Clostridiales bacterium]|nr:CDP-diacylglycerol--glycerol-3-phosphate 3-phosphatidyltransferase [Clostridiales bacterium]